MPIVTSFLDLFYWLCIPLVAGLLFIAVARTRKANTYSPLLAFGMILIGSVVFILAWLVIGTVMSIFGLGR